MAKTSDPEAWRNASFSVPVGALVVVVVAVCGIATAYVSRPASAAPAIAVMTAENMPATQAEVRVLHDDVLKLTASVDQLGKTLVEVKEIEDRFHPRGDPPPAPPAP